MPPSADTIAPHQEREAERGLRQQRAAQSMPSLAAGRPHPKGLSSDLSRGPKGAAGTSPLRDTPQVGERRNIEDPKTGGQRKENPKESARNMLGQWKTLREKLRRAEKIKKRTLQKQGAEAAQKRGQQLEGAAQKVTAQALKQAWLNLISSWGATILWIDLHFIFSELGGPISQYFCKMGQEWDVIKVPLVQRLCRIGEIVLMFIANVVVVVALFLIVLIAIISFCISPVGIPVCGAMIVSLGIQSGAL